MLHSLIQHPDSFCSAVSHIDVELWRPRAGGIVLRYVLKGDMSSVALPEGVRWTRKDELWKHTCFEAFVRALGSRGYYELNFAPSTAWAAYTFGDYRADMRPAMTVEPVIELKYGAEMFELRAYIAEGQLIDLPEGGVWRLGLSAVIEETNGAKSYWALKHAPGKPDFHHPDSFAIELPTAERP